MPDNPNEPANPSADDDTLTGPPAPEKHGIPNPGDASTAGESGVSAVKSILPNRALLPEDIGSVIGRYKLLELIGKGGFGQVWRAEQTEPIQREVALKIIKPGMDSREIIERFEAERQTLALMDHPNIAAVLDAGTTPRGLPYFVMELVRGAPINEYCDACKLRIRERLELFIPVCQAVQHAHQKAILHGDLKPSNILVAEVDGKPMPKVIDFGIAKFLCPGGEELLRASPALTQEGRVIGTPQYMSPEQAGSVPDVDTRSDVYTLGVILHELLVGQTPLSREQMSQKALDEMLRLIREGEIERPSSRLAPVNDAVRQCASERNTDPKKLGHALRGDLDWIVIKALAKERDRRYGTANALAQDLRRCIDDEPVSAGPPSASYRLRKLVKRNKGPVAAAAAVLLCLIGGVVATSIALVREREALREAVAQRQEAIRQRNAAVRAQAEERKQREAALAAREEERKQREAALAAQEEERKQREAALAAQEEERKQRDLVRQREIEQRLQIHDASMAEYATAVQRLEKDGRWHEGVAHLQAALNLEPTNQVAAARLYSTLTLFAPEKQNWPRQILRLESPAESAQFSADGARIVTASGRGPMEQVWDAATGKLISSLSHSVDRERLRHADFSGDGTRVVTITTAGRAQVWDVASGKAVGEAQHLAGELVEAWLNRDGTRILTESSAMAPTQRAWQVWDVATGKAVGRSLEYEAKILATGTDGFILLTSLLTVDFSPDGKRIVTASNDGTARVWDAETGKAVGEVIRHEAVEESASERQRLPFPLFLQHSRPKGAVRSARFSPDGKSIVTASDDNTARIWDVASSRVVGEAMRHEATVNSAQFSPDGKSIVTASDDRTARVWDAASGKALAEPLRHGERGARVSRALFSADGKRIITLSEGATARVWDPTDGKELTASPKYLSGLLSLHFSADGMRFETIEMDSDLREWDAASGAALRLRKLHRVFPESMWLNPDETLIVSNETEGARVWNVASGMPVGEALRGQKFIRTPFSPDGFLLVTDGVATRVWNVAAAQAVGVALRCKGSLYAGQFSPDGTQVVTVSSDSSAGYGKELSWVQVWDVRNGNAVGDALRHEGGVTSARFSPDGRWIAVASFDRQSLSDRVSAKAPEKGSVQVWDVASGKPVGESLFHEGRVNDAQFSPNGNQIVTVSNDKTARVWDVAEAPLLAIKEISQNRKIELSANLNYYQSAGRIRVGAAVAGNVVWVWDEAGKMVAALRHGSHVVFWKLSPDGKGMVTICEDATVKVWNLADEKATSETLRHEGQPPPALDRDHRPVGGAEWKWGTGWQSAEFSPDASRLVTVSEATAQVWDVAGGKAESPRQVEPMSIARFSADGTRIVIVGSGRTAQVWDAATGKPVGDALLHEEKVNFAQFNPDGTRIVTACDDGTVTVWDAATGKPVGEALRHAGRVRKAEFSPDGRQIVTVRNDGNGQTLSVWDVASGKTIGQEFKQGQLLRDSVWFSPDGTRLVTILEGGDGKQSVQVWEVASGKVLLHIPTARTAVFSPDGKRLVTAVEKTIQVWDVTSGKPLGDALDDDDWVSNLNFSSDGTRIVTGASLINHTRRVWWVPWLKDLPSPAPEWFRQRAAAIAGFEFDANGETHVLPAAQRIATLLAPVQGNDAWSLLARWLAQPAGERTLNPDSPLTRRQTAERERDKGMSIELQYGPRPIDYAQAAYARLEIFPQLEAFRAALHTALREDSTAPLTRLLLCEFEGTKKRAAFLRDYDLKRLPDDAGLWARASLALTRQRQPKAAIDAARKALSLDGESPLAWRAEAGALSAKGDREESLASYERLLAMGRGGLVDYDSAVFLAVELGNGDRARKIIAMAEQQFPSVAFVSSMEGRALMDLHAPQEAIAAFERYQALLKPPEKIDNGMIARLAISRWLTGDKDGAVREYEKLLALKNEPWWGDSEKLSKTAFPPVEMTPLKEIIAETLKRRAEMPPPQK